MSSVMKSVLLVLMLTKCDASAVTKKISVAKCCRDQHYRVGYDTCKDAVLPDTWPPSVYSVAENKTVSFGSVQLEVSHNLTQCPDGFVGRSSTDFRFYDDGSLSTADGVFHSGQFCLDQMAKAEGEPEFVARFCVRDPCLQASCIRKCCPDGMVISASNRLCQSGFADQLQINIRDEYGVSVNATSAVIRDGGFPRCSNGINQLNPANSAYDEFYLLPSGNLYVPGNLKEEDRTVKKYCVEQFTNANVSDLIALTCFPEPIEQTTDNLFALSFYPYLLFFSSIFLVVTFVVYALLPEIRNIHGVTIMCHVASLAVMYIGLGTIQLVTTVSNAVCIGLAVVVHFSFLSVFTWLNVMSFDIWLTFSNLRPRVSTGRNGRHHRLGLRFVFYSIYAWGVPFIIVLIGQILDHLPPMHHVISPHFGRGKCWFVDDQSKLAYLHGPVGVLIFSNVIFFILTAVQLHRASNDAAFATNNTNAKQKFRVIISLFVLMGVSWTTEIISFAVGGLTYIWIPTDVINILTGIFIFVIFVCKRKVWNLLKARITSLGMIESYLTRYQHDASSSGLSKSQTMVSDCDSQTKHHSSLGNVSIVIMAPNHRTSMEDSHL